jgi:hypothetical protein
MIDVHILTMPGDNPVWFDQCLASLETEPVKVHVCPGIDGDIGNARADAFMLGDGEYVSFVDPDDYVLPGGFSVCVTKLQKDRTVGACTSEIVTGFRGEVTKNPYIRSWVHHLIVLKRSIVLDCLDVWRDWTWPSKVSEGRRFVEFLRDRGQPVSFIPQPYYVWRRHHQSFTTRGRLNGR